MKKIIFSLLLLGSFSVYAISDAELIKKCQDVAIQKIQNKVEQMGLNKDSVHVEVCAIDNRTTNIFAKYLLFCATAADLSGELRVIAQKPMKGECFAGNAELINVRE